MSGTLRENVRFSDILTSIRYWVIVLLFAFITLLLDGLSNTGLAYDVFELTP
jgi:cytochrome b559 alpha subunit